MRDSTNLKQRSRILDSYQPKNAEYERAVEASRIYSCEGDIFNGIDSKDSSQHYKSEILNQDAESKEFLC